MITVAELNRRVKRLNVETTSEESIDQTKEDYKSSQRDQMLHGLKADGSKIGKYRSPAYARRKYAMNPLAGFGNMDWRLTGSLHKEIFVHADNGLVVTGSADEKFNKLAGGFWRSTRFRWRVQREIPSRFLRRCS
jgi:hypothetical protein